MWWLDRKPRKVARWFEVLCAAAVLSAAAGMPPARANVASQVHYSRGLISFHQARWSEALAAFDQAVQADPRDARARYYRGLTHARLGDSRRAVEDIEAALREDPNLPHAQLDLGIAYLSLGEWAPAVAALERAYKTKEERWVAAFFLGLALYQQQRLDEALRYFEEAQADPEVRAAAAYYAGLIHTKREREDVARPLFETVVRELPGSEIAAASQRYLARGGRTGTGQKPWWVYGRGAFEYDSNVSIGPKDNPPSVAQDITEKSDGRVVVGAGLRYTLWDDADWSAALGYDLSQSVHFDLRRFDLQGHKLSGELAVYRPAWSAGLGAGYAFYALDYQSFFHEGLVTPWLTWHATETAATQAFVAFRGRDFFRRPYDPGRDARNYGPGLRQYFSLGRPDRMLVLGYQYELEDTVSNGPQGRTFDYQGHELRIETSWTWAETWNLQAGYAFRNHSYDHRESGFGMRKRSDDAHEFALSARYPLGQAVALNAAYIGQIHDSNVKVFEYDRHILSVGVQVVY